MPARCAGTTPAEIEPDGWRAGRRRACTGPPRTPTTPGRASTRSTCSRTPRATCTWATPRRSAAATPSPVPADARPQRAAPDRMGRVRPARRERRDQARDPPARSGPTRTSSSRRRSFQRYGDVVRLDARSSNTCDPEYYRWTQWLFLKLFERGLAYRKTAPANWCPKDQTVLANEQVVDGALRAVRHAVVRKRPDAVVLQDHRLRASDCSTTSTSSSASGPTASSRCSATGSAAPRAREVDVHDRGDRRRGRRLHDAARHAVGRDVLRVRARAPAGREARRGSVGPPNGSRRSSTGPGHAADDARRPTRGRASRSGVLAVNPVNGERIPCFVAPYVLMEYGTGAVMGVPAHDQRDFEFARAHELPIRVVDRSPRATSVDPDSDDRGVRPRGRDGALGPVRRRALARGDPEVIAWLERRAGHGRRQLPAARLADLAGSGTGARRSRSSTAPSTARSPCPRISCPSCCPTTWTSSPGGESPLARHPAFVTRAVPECGGPARRDTDTMDTFVDSSWYFFRYCSPADDDGPFDPGDVARWMPVDQYTGGVEHAILHLLYCPVLHEGAVRHRAGRVRGAVRRAHEPGHGAHGRRSMSKSKGNIVRPMPIVERWGADTIRLTICSRARRGRHRLEADRELRGPAAGREQLAGPGVRASVERTRVARDGRGAGGAACGITHDDQGRDRGHGAVPVQHGDLEADGADERDAHDARRGRTARGKRARALAQMLAPLAPFAAEELWRVELGNAASVHRRPGPRSTRRWPRGPRDAGRPGGRQGARPGRGRCRFSRGGVPGAGARLRGRPARRRRSTIARVVVRPPKLVNIVTGG